jgi:hypothetical protein
LNIVEKSRRSVLFFSFNLRLLMAALNAIAIGPNVNRELPREVRLVLEPESAPNCMGRIVLWLGNAETYFIHKVGAIALTAIGTLAIGYLVGHTLLVFSATALVVGIWGAMERDLIVRTAAQRILEANREIREAEQDRVARQAAFAKMQEAVGGAEAWEQLPILDIGERSGDYLGFIRAREVIAPIMRGSDRLGRSFITMKLRLRENGGEPQVVTIFQRFMTGSRWTHASFGNWPFNVTFDNRDWDTLRQIVTGEHPRIQLVHP